MRTGAYACSRNFHRNEDRITEFVSAIQNLGDSQERSSPVISKERGSNEVRGCH